MDNPIGEMIEKVPQIYEDGLKPTTEEAGKLLALIPKAINASLAPLRKWVAQQEYNVSETEKLLALKLSTIDIEKITTPEPYVAVPAIQAISYSMSNETLRDLYANLLAKSMNIDTKDSVHPGFVEIIKQLSPIDAKVFKFIMSRKENPLVHISIELPNGSGVFPMLKNLTDIAIADYLSVGVAIDSLCRQGLISIPMGRKYSNVAAYDNILSTEYYTKLIKVHGDSIHVEKLHISVSEYGKRFYSICVQE